MNTLIKFVGKKKFATGGKTKKSKKLYRTDRKQDAERAAKPKGLRIADVSTAGSKSKKRILRKPTKAEAAQGYAQIGFTKHKVYSESRPERSDVKHTGKTKL